MLDRPAPSEYHEYYHTYVRLVPDGDITETLADQILASVALFDSVPPEHENYAYEAGKWTVRESLGHIIDTERLFAYRAMSFARGDQTPLPGMDQDEWVRDSNASHRTVASMLDEWVHLRAANVAMFRSFDDEIGRRSGIASDREFSVRAFAWIMAGHELHHRGVLSERYIAALP